jgi:hypothetical protein
VSFQPTGGYFLTKNIELLIDVQYMLSFTHDNSIKYWDHTLGFDIGASYNYQINPFLSIFLGSKIGLNWQREIMKEFVYSNDNGWSKRQISFPIFLLGGRFVVTKDWSILALVEYSKTDLYSPIAQWTKNNNEDVSFGLGFSVFL